MRNCCSGCPLTAQKRVCVCVFVCRNAKTPNCRTDVYFLLLFKTAVSVVQLPHPPRSATSRDAFNGTFFSSFRPSFFFFLFIFRTHPLAHIAHRGGRRSFPSEKVLPQQEGDENARQGTAPEAAHGEGQRQRTGRTGARISVRWSGCSGPGQTNERTAPKAFIVVIERGGLVGSRWYRRQ